MKNTMKSLLLVVFLVTLAGACAPSQVVVKVNGMRYAPETELQSDTASRISFTYSYYRLYKAKISSGGYEEEIRDTEPIKLTDLHLPKSTEAIGIMIYVDNPEMRRYKIVLMETRGEEIKENVIYEGIRPEILIRSVFPSRDLTNITLGAKLVLQDRNDALLFKGVTISKLDL